MATTNIWSELPEAVNVRTPVQILREQAALLRERTNGTLDARVEVSKVNDQDGDGRVFWDFVVVAPALLNYRYKILTIGQPTSFYPVTFDDRSDGPHASSFPVNATPAGIKFADNEEIFMGLLINTVKSARVQKAIQALLVQSRA